ncbi:MAG: amine oxidase, partial [Anaerolineaceae bacterium]
YGEFGAARIPISHETTWHYINMLGINTEPSTVENTNTFLYVHNTRLRITDSIERYLYPLYNLTPIEKSTPWNKLSSYAMNHAFLSLPANIRSELIQILPSYSPDILPLMNISVRENLENMGLSQGAIQLLSDIDPVVGSFLHHSYDELAGLEYTLDNRILYRIPGGFCLLPYAFYNSLIKENPTEYKHIDNNLLGRVNMRLGQLVTGIYQSNYRNKIIIKYKNSMDTTEGADIYDYCICAIPFSTLRTVEIKPSFSNTKMQAITELNYADAQKTLFLCNRKFWERDTDYGRIRGGASFTDLPIQTILYPKKHQPSRINNADMPGVLIASYGLGQDATRVGGIQEPYRYYLVRRSVEEVHGLPGGFLNALVEESRTIHWNDESFFLGAFANCLPRQKPLFLYEMQRPEYNNRLFFAGEHISSKHGWMQGALYSGKYTANALAKSFTTSKFHG